MEYFLGSLITILTLIIASKLFSTKIKETSVKRIVYTQSYIYDLIGPLLPSGGFLEAYKTSTTQSRLHQDQLNVRVLFVEGKAYWIKDNQFFTATAINGMVVEETISKVDIMGMDKVELEKMVFIVDKLTEGKSNDSGNPGHPKF